MKIKIKIKRDMFRIKLSTLIFTFILICAGLIFLITGPHKFTTPSTAYTPIETIEEEPLYQPEETYNNTETSESTYDDLAYGEGESENAIDDTNGY